jgi:hypothetical protein
VLPAASFVVAANVVVEPCNTETVLGCTVTVATGTALTVMVAVADLPRLSL